ncbi:MAG: hypothetical protein ACRCU6_03490 [Fusobacteriaceae bacterium]
MEIIIVVLAVLNLIQLVMFLKAIRLLKIKSDVYDIMYEDKEWHRTLLLETYGKLNLSSVRARIPPPLQVAG